MRRIYVVLIFVLFLADHNLNGCTREIVSAANGVFQIPLIGEVQQPFVVNVQYEQRRTGRYLRREEYAHTAALIRRGFLQAYCVPDKVVELARRYAETCVGIHFVHRRKHFFYALPRLCGNVNGFVIIHKLQIFLQLFFKTVDSVGILFNQVPLVHNDNRRLALFVHVADNLDVLFG